MNAMMMAENIGAGALLRWVATDPLGVLCCAAVAIPLWACWVAFLARLVLFWLERQKC